VQISDLVLLASAESIDHFRATSFEQTWTLDAVLKTGASKTLATARGPARRFKSLDTLCGVLSAIDIVRGLELKVRL
jgi:hypothetical protein